MVTTAQPAKSKTYKKSQIILYIFVPVLLALIVSAICNLQLFQDGSSYLFEILQSNSAAIRHHRLSIWLVQIPTVLLAKILAKLPGSLTSDNTQFLRFIFSLSYSLIPFIALLLSWIALRRRNEGLFIWAALIILFINLVNFSWVSELLMAVQFSCPLLLASIVIPGKRIFWILNIILLPFIFLLHPLVSLLFLTLAIASAYVSYKNVKFRQTARFNSIIFIIAAILRELVNIYSLTAYEKSFLEPKEGSEYLFATTLENQIFLTSSIIIGILCLIAKWQIKSNVKKIVIILLMLLQALGIVLFLINIEVLLKINMVLLTINMVVASLFVWYKYNLKKYWKGERNKIYLFYICCIGLAAIAAGLLVGQYLYESFPLKTGLSLFASMLIMLMASIDSVRKITKVELNQRFRLVTALSIIFAVVIITKSFIWQSSIQKLTRSLAKTNKPCIEVISKDFAWIERNPYRIINNWSLPSLALVVQDRHPRKLLLEANSCQLYYQSGIVQIDPWTKIPKDSIIPSLGK